MQSNTDAHEYAELKWLLAQKGLFDRQPVYYTYKVLQMLSFLVLALGILMTTDLFWVQILNAVFLAFVFSQIAFMGHDAGHRQIFQSSRKTDVFGLLCNLLTAVSYSWWIEKHNRHHSHPNHLERDPDVRLRLLAFSHEQTCMMQGFRRFVVKHQARLFFPMLLLQGFAMRFHSITFLLHKRARFPVIEPLFIVVHFCIYFGLVFSLLSLWQGLVFILVHQALFGLYMGSVFAPNHKGMPVLQGNCNLDRLRQQVVTARNVRSHPLTDFWFGGLNYQIEHHLFPRMARNKLKEAQATVKAFCQAHSIPYCETGIFQAYREILRYLHEVSAPLRQAGKGHQSNSRGTAIEPGNGLGLQRSGEVGAPQDPEPSNVNPWQE
jgi:fatty acid desaturase